MQLNTQFDINSQVDIAIQILVKQPTSFIMSDEEAFLCYPDGEILEIAQLRPLNIIV